MNQLTPLVSIIMPAYNAERFIAQTIDSVLKQSYTNWELIIVNDGSNDNTLKVAEKYQSVNPAIKIISQENKGVSVTRNVGLKNATGEMIALLDADDVWLENNLEEKVDLLESNSSVDFVFSDCNLSDEKMQNIKSAPLGSDLDILENTLLWNGESVPGTSSNLVFKKTCLAKNIHFHPDLSNIADKHFVIQLASHFKGKRIPKALWNYRVVRGSMSKNIRLHETDTLKAYAIFKESGYFKNIYFERKCFSNMYLILGASWWKDGNNKIRGIYFILRAFLTAPLNTLKKIGLNLFKLQD